ncbi:class I SAM-dependent methyltransferase [Gehongia tenuis]|uniref:Class I SAM-dependent methyltransferase n=1 Tax=Gehongia tenuis TaxID=2763655 RepID=A0A926D7M5_9FIRM|nr:class I SAM-dependent methyltransferase [Gehongia tenuis]MBC8532349.1 class I SAM-dependent methyltransferase [Gehongia tenuis]
MNREYTKINSKTVDEWVKDGWEWGRPIDHSTFSRAQLGQWDVLLTPTRPVPHEWFCDLKGAELLGLASGGGQQMPIFTALGARCTVLDYSKAQLSNEEEVAKREGYTIKIVEADMTKPLPFPDAAFDLIFHPVSNCYVEKVEPIWRECWRILKPGGILLAGFSADIVYAFDDSETRLQNRLPYNPLKDKKLYALAIQNHWGIQFSHSLEEQIDGQIKAGFRLTGLYQDTTASGPLHDYNIPVFYATRAVK